MYNKKFSTYSPLSVLILMLLAIGLGACGDNTPAPALLLTTVASRSTTSPGITTTPAVQPVSSDITYKFGADVSITERDQIRKGMELSVKVLGPAGPVLVRTNEKSLLRRSREGLLGTAIPGEVVFYTTNKAWQTISEGERIATVFHEYYHIVQYHLAGIEGVTYVFEDRVEGIYPYWLVEGSAEYVSHRVAADNNLLSYEQSRNERIRAVRGERVPLSSIENDNKAGPDPYDIGFLATEYLVNNYGGQAALQKFWANHAVAANWKAAFQKSFGVSVDDFYQKFEQHRRAQFPIK